MSRVRSVGDRRRVPIGQGWEFAQAAPGSTLADASTLAWRSASGPMTAAATLRELGGWTFDTSLDFDDFDWWWRTRIDAALLEGASVLGFDGLATLADVWLDGEHLLRSENMFVAHALPLRGVRAGELLIRCASLAPELAKKRTRPRWRVPMLPHAQLRWIRTTLLGRTPGWSPPCPPIGPWRPVWLERRGLEMGAVRLDARLENARGIVDLSLKLDDRVESAALFVERDGQAERTPLARSGDQWNGRVVIDKPVLWWPHTHGGPARYRVWIEAMRDGARVDIDLGDTGFRTLTIDRGAGDFRVRVNGVDVFCRGACWTPLDVVSLAAEPDQLRAAVAQAAAAGMNMLRVGGTMVYEVDAFYDALDEMGVLLWQDLMFANMDYPDEESFVASVCVEVDQQLARLQARPSVALICGNSEGEQQAAMSGAARDRWSPPLFHQTLAGRVREAGFEYLPSSAHGGPFPHAADVGTCSYYGVGAYLRPLEDARRSGLRFASECLAFANIPDEDGLPGGPALRVHHAAWKARSPRDLGAGWDFDDVRDHYVARLFGVDPAALRVADHARYLALGRVVTGEVMAAAFSEWRRPGSPTRGALVWFLRDLWPGAGWGLVDSGGHPKPCLYPLGRALAPIAVAISDEGVNGLVLHVYNDRHQALAADLELCLYRYGETCAGRATAAVTVPAHSALDVAAASLFEGFLDLSFAYRFGPPLAHVVHATLRAGDHLLSDTFWFPGGWPAARELDVGLTASVRPGSGAGETLVDVGTRRFAQSVFVEAPGHVPDDNGFHLAPGQTRTLKLRASQTHRAPARATLTALNAETTLRFNVP